MHAIYEIRNTANGKVYVGSAMNLARRFIEHKRDLKRGTHVNCKLQNAWNKYGKDAFTFSVIEEVSKLEDLIGREQFWIDSKDVIRAGYNLSPTAGSLLGVKFSTETKHRMSLAKIGTKKTKEHAEKVRIALTGRKMTEEQKQKMRYAKLGIKRGPHSEETKARMSLASIGRSKSPEHRAALSAAKLGKKQPPELVQKRADAIRKAIQSKKQLNAINQIQAA